eukprot:TRINITY_DN2440_c1_g2_i5.p4 TRINITY_DN2440_c1_g2~~TRINITY_DN2440_c1_g2_i5.p4  ORF type:complete len:289 (+),score=-9.04 TRINITY_DN2440_c1_g2_i5:1394-2260(+)
MVQVVLIWFDMNILQLKMQLNLRSQILKPIVDLVPFLSFPFSQLLDNFTTKQKNEMNTLDCTQNVSNNIFITIAQFFYLVKQNHNGRYLKKQELGNFRQKQSSDKKLILQKGRKLNAFKGFCCITFSFGYYNQYIVYLQSHISKIQQKYIFDQYNKYIFKTFLFSYLQLENKKKQNLYYTIIYWKSEIFLKTSLIFQNILTHLIHQLNQYHNFHSFLYQIYNSHIQTTYIYQFYNSHMYIYKYTIYKQQKQYQIFKALKNTLFYSNFQQQYNFIRQLSGNYQLFTLLI